MDDSISVVLATYNGEAYIVRQLESLKEQTRCPDEIIICDDTSTDKTVSLIREYIRDQGIENARLYVNERNLGFRDNFINCIERSSGSLIFFCDQDDIWGKEKIERMSRAMAENTEIKLLACGFNEFIENGGVKNRVRCRMADARDQGVIKKIPVPENLLEVPYPGCTYCIRRDFYDMVKPYWVKSCPHDAVLWRSALVTGSAYIYDEPLMDWRKHSDSSWHKENAKPGLSEDIKWRVREETELRRLLDFAEDNTSCEKDACEKISYNLAYVRTRRRFYMQKHIRDGVYLLKYIRMYPRYRTYLRDWMITYRG